MKNLIAAVLLLGCGVLQAATIYTYQGSNVLQHDAVTGTQLNTFTVGNGGIAMAYVPTVVPIPAAVWLFGSGLAGLGFLRRKKS